VRDHSTLRDHNMFAGTAMLAGAAMVRGVRVLLGDTDNCRRERRRRSDVPERIRSLGPVVPYPVGPGFIEESAFMVTERIGVPAPHRHTRPP
jgi:hypothetical protein